jgi:hypothetical protein
MTEPRPLPDRVSGFRSRAINGILDYLVSLRPIDTRTVRHAWTPHGIASHARDSGADYVLMPFDFVSIVSKVVTLESGDFEIHGETAAGTTTRYKTVSPMTVTLAASGTEYVYAQIEWTGSAWGTPTLAKGASKPSDTATIYRKLLWTFTNGAPTKQWHRGNIEFVGWRMES